jgi:periplasmic divalent cation tolerance protein
VRQQLAACVNILPKMHSIYQWDGEVHSESEYLLIIKTLKPINKKTFKGIKQLHPYEVPEIVSIDISDGDIDYLKWIENSVQ